MSKTALVIGTTGLVGSHLVQELLVNEEYSTVKVFVRRATGISHPKLQEFICNFNRLDEIAENIKGDVLYSAMGTTLKQAGSKENQYEVDFTYQYEFARLAADNDVKEYILVSSVSANARSKAFYLRIKGELEEAVKNLDFEKIIILQPSGLMGQRDNKRKREVIGIAMMNAIIRVLPGLKKYRGIKGATVAKAMVNLAKKSFNEKAITIRLDEIFEYA
ncbi:NAD(P)H-binding protein [Carboxylicivirga caseinilyticus]|uniref:NAD(P)H-binding protein n=1 Tax=Carboxylicivirga caseinilyticus TaxID=3417572 RepID=UPI003D338D16|nr:NAD(P)H-binding protein [Marinilabiliaceae bacterium A049]